MKQTNKPQQQQQQQTLFIESLTIPNPGGMSCFKTLALFLYIVKENKSELLS